MAPSPPPGHRRLEQVDVRVGLPVVYISRDETAKQPIQTWILEEGLVQDGTSVALKHKNPAPIKRVFVPIDDGTTAVGVVAALAPATASATPSDGSARGSAVGDADDAASGDAEVNEFLQKIVAPWMERLEQIAADQSILVADLLVQELAHLGSTPEDVVQAFKKKVPWATGTVGLQAVPKSSRKGSIHISMLSYEKASYAANGMFVHDARLLLLTEGFAGLSLKTLAVRPRPGVKLTTFGWEADGAVVNSTYAFALTSVVACALACNVDLPQPLARLLQNIPAYYTHHDSSQTRLLQNLVDSAVQRHANRTVQCPIYLAEELGRCTFQPGFVKPFVQLYQQRMSVRPQLQMPRRIEDCVVRLMTPSKTCLAANAILTRCVVKYTWQDGPWQVGHLISPQFPIGASLNNSLVEEWANVNVQTAHGQTLALQIAESIFAKTMKRVDPEDEWTVLLVACGLWTQAKEKLLPSLMLGASTIDDLDSSLCTNESFRKDLAVASAKDPPTTMSAVGDMADWLVQHVSELRRAKQASIEAARLSGSSHPTKLLGDAEAAELAAYNYVSSCVLDVESYRHAMEKFTEETDAMEKQWRELHSKFAANLGRVHQSMQQSDIVFWEPPQRLGVKRTKAWLEAAVTASVSHRRNLKTILGVKDTDICQINVFSLYTLGTVKKNTLSAIASSLSHLEGVSILFYPVIPKKLKRATVDTISWAGGDLAAVGAAVQDSAASGSDSDVDEEEHDFTADGVLPEALTSLHTVKSAAQRNAQLAADCHEVDRVVGMADIDKRYPKCLHFLHTADSTGEKSTTLAMLILPTQDSPGVNMTSLAECTAVRNGSYTDVPVPCDWILVSKKIALQARRAMAERGMMDTTTAAVGATCARYAGNKIARAQLGTGLHEVWLRDFIKTCGTKVLYVCDYAHGAGELAKATISAKASVEATSAGVRVCLWAHDPRKIFAVIGQAVGRTEMSKLFQANKLVVPGHQPVPDPGPRPERTRKLVKATLSKPMKVLSLDVAGNLIIPTEDEITKACPVSLTPEQQQHFSRWRLEFPRQVAVMPPTAEPKIDPNGGGGGGTIQTPTVKPGHVVKDQATLKQELGDEIVSEVPLPSGHADVKLALGKVVAADGAEMVRVWLHNSSNKQVALPGGAFLGQGGPGSFVNLVQNALPEAQVSFAWRYTRFTGYKKDNAELANGYMILNKAGSPLPGNIKPKLVYLSEIEAELGNSVTLYGHAVTRGGAKKVTITPSKSPVSWVPATPAVGGASPPPFSTGTLGQYLRSHEDTQGVPKCMGLVRPVFEMKPGQPSGAHPAAPGTTYVLQPGAPTGHSALWLFTSQKIELPAGAFVCLG
jgi:hypothetical protein